MALRWLFLLGVLGASGCTLYVTYQSDPQSALVYEGSKQFGYTPIKLQYTPTQEFINGGCMKLRPISVRWASGAEASVNSISVCAANGYNQQLNFVRPNVDGRELDVRFAIEMQRNSILQQQAQAQQDMARRS